MMRACDVYLAVSYRPACVDGSPYRRAIEAILEQTRSAGMSIYTAPAEETWGDTRPPRREALAYDRQALQECSCFVYFVGGFESDGALVELGMALALGKRIVLLRWSDEILSSHVKGLAQIGDAEEDVVAVVKEEYRAPLERFQALQTC